jgi:hypothetical protein
MEKNEGVHVVFGKKGRGRGKSLMGRNVTGNLVNEFVSENTLIDGRNLRG